MSESELPLDIDLSGDDLTLNEQIAVEEVCGGRAFDDLRREGRRSFYRAVAWATLRRQDPHITLERAGELKMRDGTQEM